jgi:hypothetical protein
MQRGKKQAEKKIRNKPTRRVSLEIKDKIKTLWEQGVSSLQLEEDFKIRAGSIRTMAQRGGWVRTVEEQPKPGLPERLRDNPDQLGAFMDVLNDGGNLNLACRFSGLPRGTVDRWLVERPDFAGQVERAKADSAVRALKALNGHALTDWKPASHILAHNPLTREDWTPSPTQAKGGINIVIKFDRYAEDEPVTIEGQSEPG